jgi:hypothetical protein
MHKEYFLFVIGNEIAYLLPIDKIPSRDDFYIITSSTKTLMKFVELRLIFPIGNVSLLNYENLYPGKIRRYNIYVNNNYQFSRG